MPSVVPSLPGTISARAGEWSRERVSGTLRQVGDGLSKNITLWQRKTATRKVGTTAERYRAIDLTLVSHLVSRATWVVVLQKENTIAASFLAVRSGPALSHGRASRS